MRPLSSIVPKKGAERWLYETLRHLQQGVAQSQAGLNAVIRNQVPDGSGNTLVPPTDLSGYFKLIGRSPGQVAYGSIDSAGTLTLGSTSHATKGFLYIGGVANARIAYDETNAFLGIDQDVPTAPLHIKNATSMIQLEATGVTHTVNGTSGDMKLAATDSGFQASGTTSAVTAGMLVTGTGVAANTFVRHVNGNTDLSLTQALTQTITGGTVTFTDSGLFRRTADESGTDIDLFIQGALRITAGVSAPMRILSDQLDDSTIGLVTGAVCSAVAGTRTLTGTGNPFTNVLDNAGAVSNGYAAGDIVTGSGIPTGTYVVTKVTSGQLTLSNTLPLITTQVMTFKRQNNVSVVEVGILSLGNAIGANLQIGGPGRGELAFFHFLSNRGWFSRQSAAGAMQVGVGFNANPKDFVSGWTGWYFNEPLSISGADFVIASSPTGTAPNKTIGGTYFSVTTANGRAHFENAGNQGFYITGTDDQINVFQRSNDLNMLRILRVQAWSDSLVIANSFALNLGDLNNAHRAMFVASAGHGVMTRFGISSTYTLITSAQAASSDFLAPEGATSVLRVHNAASGLNSAVIMRLSTAKAVGVQAGDMFNVLTSTGYITTSITPDGILASTTADVFWEDDNIAFEDENVYYSAIH